jgi:hypothetical protein
MEVSSQFHTPVTLFTEKNPIGQEAGWNPEPVWTLWRREISLAPAENQTPIRRSSVYNMEAGGSYNILVKIYQTIWCYIPNDSNIHTHHRENFKLKLQV